MWPAIIGIGFLAIRLAGDFDGLWRQRRPYLEAIALSLFVLSCFGFYGLAAWSDGDLAHAPRVLRQAGPITPGQVAALAHPWLALLSAGAFLLADRWRDICRAVRPKSLRCVCGYPRDFSVCPECGLTEFRSGAAWVERRMRLARIVFAAAALLAGAAIGTYSPS